MYSIGHKDFKLDGVITEFADIYAPLAQIWKNPTEEHSNHHHVKKGDKISLLTTEEN